MNAHTIPGHTTAATRARWASDVAVGDMTIIPDGTTVTGIETMTGTGIAITTVEDTMTGGTDQN